jgi:hypothetical protein
MYSPICQIEFADADKECEGIREYMAMKEHDWVFIKKGQVYYEICFMTLAALMDYVKSAWRNRWSCFASELSRPQIVVIPEMTINAMENAVPLVCKSGMLEHVKHCEQKILSIDINSKNYNLKRHGLLKPKASNNVTMKNIDKQFLYGIDNPSYSCIDLVLNSNEGKKYQTHWITPSYLLQEITSTLEKEPAFCRTGLIIVQNIDHDSVNKAIKFLNRIRYMIGETHWDHMLPLSSID